MMNGRHSEYREHWIFSLIGILLKISCLMAENNIGIFAISTFNTDYVLIKSKNFSKAIELLSKTGYRVAE